VKLLDCSHDEYAEGVKGSEYLILCDGVIVLRGEGFRKKSGFMKQLPKVVRCVGIVMFVLCRS